MDFGVIDIGSNTIRGVIYSGKNVIENVTFSSHILRDTKNGILTKDGICELSSSLSNIINRFHEKSIFEIYAFATSAMRDVTNFIEIESYIKKELDLQITLISGDQEAYYDYLAIKEASPFNSGIAVDLGGGSAQVVCFNESGVVESESFPIGAKRIRNLFSRLYVPSILEITKAEEYIYDYLKAIKSKNDKLIIMGGTGKAVSKTIIKLYNTEKITREILDRLYACITPDENLSKKLFGERYTTMPCGILVLKTLCDYFDAKEIIVTDVGVRDGFVNQLLNTGE